MNYAGKHETSGVTPASYAPFCRVGDDGRIWWRVEDAYKLGAGYQPTSDNSRQLEPVLVAPNGRVRVNERELLAAFHQAHAELVAPGSQERDDGHFVDAVEFLDWLSQYITRSQSGIAFPTELIRAVRDAVASARARHDEGGQCEGTSDHQAEAEQARAWGLWCELDDVRKKIGEYQRQQPTSITEIALRDDRIKELEARQGEIEQALGGEMHGSLKQSPTGSTTLKNLRDLPYGPERDRRIAERYQKLTMAGERAPLKRLEGEVGVSRNAIQEARKRHAKLHAPVQFSNLAGQLKAANPKGRR